MKESKSSRNKRGPMIINLVETPAGYSIVEGTEIFNRNPAVAVVNHQSIPPPVAQPISAKEQKLVVKRTHPKYSIENRIVFLKSPTTFKPSQRAEKQTPEAAKKFAEWFSLQSIHDIQLNQIKLWFSQDNPEAEISELEGMQKFKQLLQKYQKHRNQIVDVFYSNFAPSNLYMPASAIRKYICDDAYWLMRLQVFLSSWGIINSTTINLRNENFRAQEIFRKNLKQNQYQLINSHNSSVTGKVIETGSAEEKNRILKNITKNIRPYCDFCGIHTQIVWFQHIRVMDPKEISSIMKNVNSKNPPLSQKQYEIILCCKCYCNGNFPLLLTHRDFRKISVNDRLEPGKKKKINKQKRKEKKRKLKEKEQLMEDEEEYKQELEELQEEIVNKDDGEVKENSNGRERRSAGLPKETNGKQGVSNENGSGHDNQIDNGNGNVSGNGNGNANTNINTNINTNTEVEKQKNINEVIQQIVSKLQKDRVWENEETSYLLQQIEKNGENWDVIYENLIKKGFCKDCSVYDIILHFISLPQSGYSQLNQQYNEYNFIKENTKEHKSTFLNKLVQKKFDKSIEVWEQLKKTSNSSKKPMEVKQWEVMIDQFVELHMSKILSKIKSIERIQETSIKMSRFYEEVLRGLSN